jgi:acyl-CoA thioester hydrolase
LVCLFVRSSGARSKGIGPILHSTQCRFRKPLTWPDSIAIGARIPKIDADRFTIEHLLVSEQHGIAAEGWGLVVTFDYAANAKAAVPDELRRQIDKLEGRV